MEPLNESLPLRLLDVLPVMTLVEDAVHLPAEFDQVVLILFGETGVPVSPDDRNCRQVLVSGLLANVAEGDGAKIPLLQRSGKDFSIAQDLE